MIKNVDISILETCFLIFAGRITLQDLDSQGEKADRIAQAMMLGPDLARSWTWGWIERGRYSGSSLWQHRHRSWNRRFVWYVSDLSTIVREI